MKNTLFPRISREIFLNVSKLIRLLVFHKMGIQMLSLMQSRWGVRGGGGGGDENNKPRNDANTSSCIPFAVVGGTPPAPFAKAISVTMEFFS